MFRFDEARDVDQSVEPKLDRILFTACYPTRSRRLRCLSHRRANMFRRYLLPAALCIVVASTASAQSNKIRSSFDSVRNTDALRGLKSIDLFIQGIDDKAQHCGITEALVRDAFAYPISQSKLQFCTMEGARRCLFASLSRYSSNQINAFHHWS